jgi:pimeloyl-ACP methyl ester carboxylesterase
MDAVSVSGRRIAYRRAGAGPPVVLLHGAFGFDSRSWQPQIDALAGRFDVVAWDAPGCGQSDEPPEPCTLDEFGDLLAEFVTALGLPRPHLVGLSFGGALALAVYGRHPELPASLVLADAYAGWAGSLPAEEVRRRLDQATSDAALPVDVWVSGYLDGMLGDTATPVVRERVRELMTSVRREVHLTMLRAMADADLRGVLPRVAVPTLVLHGERDARAPLPVAHQLHEGIPGSRLVVLPGVGHVSNLEAADAFNREVGTFLDALA